MKIVLQPKTLSEAFRALMLVRGKGYRDVSNETGVNHPAVWRFARKPDNCAARTFVPLVRWMGITQEEFNDLWDTQFGGD